MYIKIANKPKTDFEIFLQKNLRKWTYIGISYFIDSNVYFLHFAVTKANT